MQLGAGQTVRQTFTLEVGQLAETVTVAGEAPLIDTAASLQSDSLGSQEVRELPVNRRNLTNLMSLTAGVNVNGDGMVQMNGVAAGGTGLTVDGTEANSNPEARSLAQYGGQNQISVMSLDSISEVQDRQGRPAGGIRWRCRRADRRDQPLGHQQLPWHGVLQRAEREVQRTELLLEHAETRRQVQSVRRHARCPCSAIRHSSSRHEGYQESVQRNLDSVVPYQQTRDEILRALPNPETSIVLDILNLPTEPVVSGAGVVNAQVGRWRGLGLRTRSENHIVAKADVSVMNGANLGVTYTRLRPFTLDPRPVKNNANDREFPNEQDRIAAQYVHDEGRVGVRKPRRLEQDLPCPARWILEHDWPEHATGNPALRQAGGTTAHQRCVRYGGR